MQQHRIENSIGTRDAEPAGGTVVKGCASAVSELHAHVDDAGGPFFSGLLACEVHSDAQSRPSEGVPD